MAMVVVSLCQPHPKPKSLPSRGKFYQLDRQQRHHKIVSSSDKPKNIEANKTNLTLLSIFLNSYLFICITRIAASITTLPSLFKLMSVTYAARSDGSLVNINAVLGCAIIMPKCLSNEDVDIFDDFDETRAKKILDILIYTANWLRESIGGFASQDDTKINMKVGSTETLCTVTISINLIINRSRNYSLSMLTGINAIDRANET